MNKNAYVNQGGILAAISGFKVPVWNTSGRPLTNGLIGFNTDTSKFEVCDGTTCYPIIFPNA